MRRSGGGLAGWRGVRSRSFFAKRRFGTALKVLGVGEEARVLRHVRRGGAFGAEERRVRNVSSGKTKVAVRRYGSPYPGIRKRGCREMADGEEGDRTSQEMAG